MEHALKPSTEQANSSEATPVQKEEKLLPDSLPATKSLTQSEQSNPWRIDNTEEMLGKSIVIIGAPPPQR